MIIKLLRSALSRGPTRTLVNGRGGVSWQVHSTGETYLAIGIADGKHNYRMQLEPEACRDLRTDIDEFLEQVDIVSPVLRGKS